MVLAAALALGAPMGCGPGADPQGSSPGEGARFAGAAVADEPHAALAAREILALGGTAADAAVALTFALAVTYPSAAGLGGGGQCLIYVPGADSVEILDFMPGRTAAPAGGGLAVAVPGTVRGMDALQARYGVLHWSRTLVAAERLARLGHPLSRALARDLAAASQTLFRDEGARALFASGDGTPQPEGDIVVQHDLAALLAQLRLAGGADFYSGRTARRLADAAARVGAALSAVDLQRHAARWGAAVSQPYNDDELHAAPDAGGAIAAAIFGLAAAGYAAAEGAERVRLLADAVADDAHPPAGDAPGTGFAVVDRRGMAVACGLTMNGLFGAGRLAPGTGLLLAAASDPGSLPPLAPVLLVNRNSDQLRLAAAASGGAAAPSALARVLLDLLPGERPLAAALAAPRLHAAAATGRLDVESALTADLAERGGRVVEVAALGRVNAIHCPGGLPRASASCRVASDPRGFGIAVADTR